jgi:hypothetical protein
MQVPEQEDFPIIKEIILERDRGAALIAAGFLEQKLTEAIRACLRDDKDTARQLLKPTGPLGALGNKALLGYMLRLYRKETRDDLVVIAEIRNRFAHVPEPLTFVDTYIRERCEKLTLYNRLHSIFPNFTPPSKPHNQTVARNVYLETISIAANFFNHQAKHKEFRDRAEELLPM